DFSSSFSAPHGRYVAAASWLSKTRCAGSVFEVGEYGNSERVGAPFRQQTTWRRGGTSSEVRAGARRTSFAGRPPPQATALAEVVFRRGRDSRAALTPT